MVARSGTEAFQGREVTNVRTDWVKAHPHQSRTRRPQPRRAGFRGAVIEMLEARGLLSAVAAPIRSTPAELSTAGQTAALVASSVPGSQDVPGTLQQTVAPSSPDEHARTTTKVDDGNSSSSASDDRNNSESSGALKRSIPKTSSQRQLSESPVSDPRSPDLESRESISEGSQNGADPLFGGGAGDLAEPAAAISTASTALAGSSAAIAPTVEISAPAPADPPPVSDVRGDRSPAVVVLVASSAPASPVPSSTDLLDAAIHADWEAVDGELQQFLSRLAGLPRSPDGRPSRPVWLAWIGAAGALLVARRASHRGRRLFRRSVTGEASTGSGRRPIPIGPWPLGLP
jgi:hypothetical protein